MHGQHSRLFDENVVRGIMVTTGLAIAEHIRLKGSADAGVICDFIASNAELLIARALEDIDPGIVHGLSDAATIEEESDDDLFTPPDKW